MPAGSHTLQFSLDDKRLAALEAGAGKKRLFRVASGERVPAPWFGRGWTEGLRVFFDQGAAPRCTRTADSWPSVPAKASSWSMSSRLQEELAMLPHPRRRSRSVRKLRRSVADVWER